jgi:hypothetical protein
MAIAKTIKHIIASLLVLACMNTANAASSNQTSPQWQTYKTDSTKTINHKDYQDFLSKYVVTSQSDINLVNYSNVSAADRQSLEDYLKMLSQIPINEYKRSEQLAFWINLYNALTIDVVLQHYPVKSIRDIKLGGWFSNGPWKEELISVNNAKLSLNDIEHGIIRPIWKDSRTHYALNCASISCPNLQKNAYTADNVNAMLTKAAKQYVNSPRGVSTTNNKLTLSSIYKWYKEDFGRSESEVMQSIKQYADPELKSQLEKVSRVSSYRYDWALNDSKQ